MLVDKTIEIPDRLAVFGDVSLEAAGEGPRKFSITAYSGGVMRHADYPVPVVLNVGGVKLANDRLPILTDHNGTLEASVGHTDSVSIGDSIVATGLFSGANEATREVVEKLENGMPLQASVGIRYRAGSVQTVAEGEQVSVNNRTFEGPLLVVNDAVLYEISVVPLGADQKTSVSLAASAFTKQGGDMPTEFQNWCSDRGVSTEGLSEEQLVKLTASYEAETKEGKKAVAEVNLNATADDLAEVRKRRAAEALRCDKIETLCASYGNPNIKVGDEEVSLKAHAIAEGWDVEKAELYAYRHAAPKAPAVHVAKSETTEKVLECALSRAVNMPQSRLEKIYDQKTLEAAYNKRFNNMGIQQLMFEAMQCSGYTGPLLRGEALIQGYKEHMLKAAGFTTISLPNVLGNVANQSLLRAFELAPTVFGELSVTQNRADFHARNEVMLTAGVNLQDVGKDGELKHGKLFERTYTSAPRTCGAYLQITRQDVLNDTLGAFDTLPGLVGRQGALKKNTAFHTELEKTNSGFYATGKYSLVTSNAFSLAGIEAALLAWRNKVDDNGDRILSRASILLIPRALEFKAAKLLNSTMFNETTTANTPQGASNPYVGRFRVVVSDELASATTWWLLADPSDISAFVTINGPSGPTPVINQVEVPGDVLGVAWQVYMDYGAAQHMHEGVLKCTA